jgi:hypothetical protein
VGSFSTPLTNYENDFLPMSIGIGSTNLGARLTVDYQNGIFFATASSEPRQTTTAYSWLALCLLNRLLYFTSANRASWVRRVTPPRRET